MNRILILSTSLNPGSRSRILATAARRTLEQEAQVEVDWIDLRDHPLPLCDGGAAYDAPGVAELEARIASAQAIIVAGPIYTYDLGAAAKNLVELTGSAWEDKVVSFLCAAGGPSSYMAVMAFANSLMLDFRCLVVPRFVYAVESDFSDGAITTPAIADRVAACARATARLAGAMAKEPA